MYTLTIMLYIAVCRHVFIKRIWWW